MGWGTRNPQPRPLSSCYRNALKLCEEHGIPSIAFPAISTGIFGYPVEEAARVALGKVLAAAPTLTSVNLVRFVLFSEGGLELHSRVLQDATSKT